MDISTALVTVNYSGAHWQRLEDALAPARIIEPAGQDEKAIALADVAILRGDLDARFLQGPKLRWVHCDHAGIEKSARPAFFAAGIKISGSAERSNASADE